MYPTLIILLVALQKSQLEHQFTYPSHDNPIATLPFSARAQDAIASKEDTDMNSTLQATPDLFGSSTLSHYRSDTDMSVEGTKWRGTELSSGSGSNDQYFNAY